ncbi:MAG: ABC transporter ATP-binding protein [Deltaproteobacteria bacterium]|nr:ABC transporter ATP-binding protein [Deltaproteobacteria bacterium]
MIQVQSLRYQFSAKQNEILNDVSLQISQGKLVAICGLNGSGKTTLLRLMAGFLPLQQGHVLWKQKPIQQFEAQELAQLLAWVPQDFPTSFPFTVREFVMMGRHCWQKGLFFSKEDHERVNQILLDLDLSDFATRVISDLSGGERQRVLLARAFVQGSQAIFLDEPLNHLDIKARLQVLQQLKTFNQQQGVTAVAVLHDLSLVKQYFDEVVLLHQGRVAHKGPPDEVLTDQNIAAVFELALSPSSI